MSESALNSTEENQELWPSQWLSIEAFIVRKQYNLMIHKGLSSTVLMLRKQVPLKKERERLTSLSFAEMIGSYFSFKLQFDFPNVFPMLQTDKRFNNRFKVGYERRRCRKVELAQI